MSMGIILHYVLFIGIMDPLPLISPPLSWRLQEVLGAAWLRSEGWPRGPGGEGSRTRGWTTAVHGDIGPKKHSHTHSHSHSHSHSRLAGRPRPGAGSGGRTAEGEVMLCPGWQAPALGGPLSWAKHPLLPVPGAALHRALKPLGGLGREGLH